MGLRTPLWIAISTKSIARRSEKTPMIITGSIEDERRRGITATGIERPTFIIKKRSAHFMLAASVLHTVFYFVLLAEIMPHRDSLK